MKHRRYESLHIILDMVILQKIERIKAFDYSYSYYPAYAMSVNENYYEYVLLVEEEYRMIYIHLERYPAESVTFDKAFLPKDYAW